MGRAAPPASALPSPRRPAPAPQALQEAHNKDIEALEVKMGAEKLTWENAALQKKLDTCSEQLQEATAVLCPRLRGGWAVEYLHVG